MSEQFLNNAYVMAHCVTCVEHAIGIFKIVDTHKQQ